jgi:hypothetical protein
MKIPHFTFYVSWWFGVSGMAFWPFVVIVKSRKGDAALLDHEYTHIRDQFNFVLGQLPFMFAAFYTGHLLAGALLLLPVSWLFLYLAIPDFRFWSEVRGYRAQMLKIPGEHRALFAARVAQRLSAYPYFTFRSFNACLRALTKEFTDAA